MHKISLRNIYITRLVFSGYTQKEVGVLFGITGCRVGVVALDVCKRLVKPAEKELVKKLADYQKSMKSRIFNLLVEYEEAKYPYERQQVLDMDTVEEILTYIKSIKSN